MAASDNTFHAASHSWYSSLENLKLTDGFGWVWLTCWKPTSLLVELFKKLSEVL